METDMKALLAKIQEMQAAIAKKQDELKSRTFEADAGGGMVTAVANGRNEVVRLSIEKSLLASEDAPMIEALVISAVNAALKKADDAAHEAMQGMVGSLAGLQV